MINLLAITPYFGKTGSEIALLNLLETLTSSYKIDVFTPVKYPELATEASEAIHILSPKKITRSFSEKVKGKISPKSRAPKNSLLDEAIPNNDYDIVLLNTFASLKYFEEARIKGKRTIVYVHETELMLTQVPASVFSNVVENADLILCSSHYVRSYLETFGRTQNIEVLYPTLDFLKFCLPFSAQKLRTNLGYSNSNFVWGMAGTITTNKNPKMFLEIAEKVHQINKNARFLWIGINKSNTYENYLRSVVKEKGLNEVVVFIEKQTDDYYQYLNCLDGLLLTSFSESFSLVALEAACFGRPVVAFPCGGIVEAVPNANLNVTGEFSVTEMVALIDKKMKDNSKELSLHSINELLAKNKSESGIRFKEIISKYQLL